MQSAWPCYVAGRGALGALAAMASAASLSMAGVLFGQALRAPAALEEKPEDMNLDNELALGFEFGWTGDKLAIRLAHLEPFGPVIEITV
jgi:hypothetical protein